MTDQVRDLAVVVTLAARKFRLANITGFRVVESYGELGRALDAFDAHMDSLAAADQGAVGANHPETSRKAAKAVAPKRGTLRDVLFGVIANAGEHGRTDAELHQAVDVDWRTDIRSIGSARIDLRDKYGLIRDSGRTRLTPGGNEAIVWVLTDLGRDEWGRQTNHD